MKVRRAYATQRVWDQLPLDELTRLFVVEHVSAEQLAARFGVGPTLIRRVLRRAGILTNPSRRAPLHEFYSPEPNSGCWLWTGQLDRKGYPIAWNTAESRNVRGHRLLYQQRHGDIPAGLQLDHLCRNRACVNPEHMQPVTNAENQQRGAKAKLNADAVRAMRASYYAGAMTQEQLSQKYGVHVETIRGVLNRKTWVNVE